MMLKSKKYEIWQKVFTVLTWLSVVLMFVGLVRIGTWYPVSIFIFFGGFVFVILFSILYTKVQTKARQARANEAWEYSKKAKK